MELERIAKLMLMVMVIAYFHGRPVAKCTIGAKEVLQRRGALPGFYQMVHPLTHHPMGGGLTVRTVQVGLSELMVNLNTVLINMEHNSRACGLRHGRLGSGRRLHSN